MMKKKCFKSLILALSCTALFTACADNKGNESPKLPGNDLKSLVIPSTFDWKTTADVQCNFTASNARSRVSVFLPDATEPFATFCVGAGIDPVSLSVPTYINTLIVKYQKADGLSEAKTLNITNNTVTFAIPNDSQLITAAAQNNTKASSGYSDVINYPASSLGTMMFEDLWPSYGDFDFNDLVVNYGIELHQGLDGVKDAKIKLRYCAFGGSASLPYELYLQLDDVTRREVSLVMVTESINTKGEATADIVEANQWGEPLVVKIGNTRANKNDPKGLFTNVTRGQEMTSDKWVFVEIVINFKNELPLKNLSAKSFNFFLGKDLKNPSKLTLQEIHMLGSTPSRFGMETYRDLSNKSSVMDKSTALYRSNDNLVWAIAVPYEIPHTYERDNFLEAYPNFKFWATSGGVTNQDWYTPSNGNRNNRLLNTVR